MSVSAIYFSNAVAAIWLHPTHVQVRYNVGKRRYEDFQALLHHLTRALARHGGGRALVDQRDMAPFTAQEQQYLLAEWLPKAILEGGYRFGAVLPALDVFARLAAATVITQIKGLPMNYSYFTDEEAARTWLLAQQAPIGSRQ